MKENANLSFLDQHQNTKRDLRIMAGPLVALPAHAGAQPDRFGTRLRFGIAWAEYEDLLGSIVARAMDPTQNCYR